MANILQIKRGNKVNLPTLSAGEFGLATDTDELYIGNGASNIQLVTEDWVTTSVGDPGSDTSVPSEQAVREALDSLSASNIPITDSGSYFTGSNVETVTQEIGQELTVHKLNGFEDSTSVALSYSGTPPTVTLTFTDTVYWWSNGIRYSGSGTDDITISDTSGIHVIYYDGDTLTDVATPTHDQTDEVLENKAIVAYIYWNTNDDSVPYISNELHGCQMSGVTHHYLHDTVGLAYEEGGTISEYTLDTASDAAISFDLTNIYAYDEDIRVEVADGIASNHYEQVLTGDAEIPVIYRDATDQSWTEQAASTLPYLTGATPRIQYMDKDNSYALTEVGNGKFCSYWLIFTNDWQYPVKMVPGNQEYDNVNDVENNAQEELLNLADLAAEEITILYQFVMQDGSGGTTNAMIEAIIDYRGIALKGSNVAAATDHGSLSGLSDDDHPQYILGNTFTQDGGILVGTGAGTYQEETGATARSSIGAAESGGAEHDGFSDFVANEHINHTSVTLTAGNGLTGGGTIAANRTFTLGTPSTLNSTTTNSVTASSHTHEIDTIDGGTIT